MASYKLTESAWLAREVVRVRGILLVHMEWGKEYTVEEILKMLSTYGLSYSNPQYISIGQCLIESGIIETA